MVNGRQKGNQFERDIAKALRSIFPNIQTARLMSKSTDDRGIDLVNTGDWAFQCKRFKNKYPNLEVTLEEMDTEDKKVVIHKRDRKEILATMSLSTLMTLINDRS